MDRGILPPELKSIQQLFTADAHYVVPPYQRSFAWGKDEVEELWEDVLSTVHRESDYFLGTIVLQEIGASKYEIIDGQQRLACLTMMFSAIRNVFLAYNDDRAGQIRDAFLGAKDYTRDAPIKPKLVLNRTNNELFVRHIINSDNFDNVKKALRNRKGSDSNKLLLEAYLYFLEKITTEAAKFGTQSDDFLVPLINTLRWSLKLITITVLSGEDANLFFESLNARGKELAISDLLKNRLFAEAGDQVTRAQRLWENMESDLARKPIPEYLRHFWIAKRADEKNLIVREKQLYRQFVDGIRGKQSTTLDLLHDLQSSAGDYTKISDYSLWPDDEAFDQTLEDCIKELQLFRVTQCNPLLLNAIQTFKTPKDVVKVFHVVVNFSFRYFIIGNQSPGNLERETNKIAYGIRSGTLRNHKDVADAFRSINPDPTFRTDFMLVTMSKSRAKIARYMLAKLNNHLSKKSARQGNEHVANPDSKQVTLEHVLPQSVPSAWASSFSKGIDPADYVDRIGNLTLLNKKVNKESADTSFAEKQQLALNSSVLPINKYFQNLSQWGDKEIEQRQVALANLAVEIWNL